MAPIAKRHRISNFLAPQVAEPPSFALGLAEILVCQFRSNFLESVANNYAHQCNIREYYCDASWTEDAETTLLYVNRPRDGSTVRRRCQKLSMQFSRSGFDDKHELPRLETNKVKPNRHKHSATSAALPHERPGAKDNQQLQVI